eukprot:COSAG06_NODE_41170_length_394_cov_0.718644_2_plen_40_part_01
MRSGRVTPSKLTSVFLNQAVDSRRGQALQRSVCRQLTAGS